MPLKRTPPNKPITMSETDSESIAGYGSDSHINITGRIKRKRENELHTFMDEMRGMFDKLVSDQNIQLKNVESSLNEIKAQNMQITTAMENLSHKYDDIQKQLESLKQERKDQMTYTLTLERKIENLERQSCSTKLEIRSVPKQQNETKQSLCELTKSLCKNLNVELTDFGIKDIYRTNQKAGVKKDITSTIVVDFATVVSKENVLRNFKKLNFKEKLDRINTGLLGLPSPHKPLYISESLTPKGRRLFFLARDFAKTFGYAFCWTSYGKIFLRKSEGSPHILVNEETTLTELKKQTIPA
jgi:small-conductance mechanosensitive channel